jgi:hypothetical protein
MIENMAVLEKLTTHEEEQLSLFKRGFELND